MRLFQPREGQGHRGMDFPMSNSVWWWRHCQAAGEDHLGAGLPRCVHDTGACAHVSVCVCKGMHLPYTRHQGGD